MSFQKILDYKVVISGCALTVDAEGERAFQFNKAMKCLYDSGCKRIRAATPMRPRRGDAEQYIVRGYLA